MGPAALAQVLRSLRLPSSPNLLIGLDVKDDAAVYQLADDLALVQTVDFFPPIVDDPYTFGQIAAANALSDIYAMGGKPILALAIAGFPENLSPTVISAILQGGADKVAEAGAVIAGGHTIIDNEPKYGLCVTGLVHPRQITAKAHAQPGDTIMLTKALGTGVVTTAHKRGAVRDADLRAALASMVRLNRRAAELAAEFSLQSATDITGYGLLGHANELAYNSSVGMRLSLSAIPLLPGAREYAQQGMLPGGLERNRTYLAGDGSIRLHPELHPDVVQLLFDPQTSGGLLLIVPPAQTAALYARFSAAQEPIWQIGEIIEGAGIEVTE